MAALATTTDLETLLGRSLTAAEEATATQLLESVSAYVRRYTGRSFDGEVTETITTQADGRGVVDLPDPPVSAVTSVTDAEDNSTPDWTWDGMWQVHGLREYRVVNITYTHGETVPDDVRGVVLAAVSRQVVNPAGIRQETVGATSVTYASFSEAGALGLTRWEREILDGYRGVLSWRL